MSIILKNVGLIYSPGTPFAAFALQGINLEIGSGKLVAIIGHTGSGKSTLVQVMAGLEQPSSGEVMLDDIVLYKKNTDRKQLRRKVGMVFQYPEHQLFEETVEKELAFGLQKQGRSEAEIRIQMEKAMQFAQLSQELLSRSPFELSGGQMRRLAIASVIAMEPDYLIMDEPTAGLDPAGRDEILTGLAKWQRQTKKTVILVSHSMEDVAKLAEEILVLSDGRLVMAGDTKSIFARGEELQQVGLDVPQVTALMMELKRKGWDVPTDVISVQQAYESIAELLRRKRP